ncbi:unnamed protein product [Arctogadus glacialis]
MWEWEEVLYVRLTGFLNPDCWFEPGPCESPVTGLPRPQPPPGTVKVSPLSVDVGAPWPVPLSLSHAGPRLRGHFPGRLRP